MDTSTNRPGGGHWYEVTGHGSGQRLADLHLILDFNAGYAKVETLCGVVINTSHRGSVRKIQFKMKGRRNKMTNEETDARVLEAIRRGVRRAKEIQAHIADAQVGNRDIDRSLQRLRKAKSIRFRTGAGWSLVPREPRT